MKKVTCNGCFGKGLHQGHLFLIGYAYALSNNGNLIIGINSDDYIRKTKKYEPLSEQERINEIMSLGIIKNVIVFNEQNACEFIKQILPDVHCIGEEYKDNCPEEQLCRDLGIDIEYIPRIGNWSTRKDLKK